MKFKTRNILLLILLMIAFSSCQEFLDVVPDNVATIENAFSDKYNAYKYLTTCYSYLPEFAGTGNNPALLGDDEIWYPDYWSGNNGIQVSKGLQRVTNPRMDYWTGNNGGKPLYEGIRACNTFLENVETVRDLSRYGKDVWIAEVKVLKAYYHFYLTRMYGPVHIMDENIDVSANTTAVNSEREHVDSCFNYSARLIDEALEYLPLMIASPAIELGRINKPVAAALKAKILLTAASPQFNGNPDYATMANKNGTNLFNPLYDHGKWQMAADACKTAIDLSHDAGFHLFTLDDLTEGTSFIDSIRIKLALRSRVTERWNPEVVWASTGSMVTGIQGNSTPRLYPCTANPVSSNHGATLRIAEQFYSKHGVPIEEDLGWNYLGRYDVRTGDAGHRYYIAEGEPTASLNFDREYRFYSDLSHDRALWFGNGKTIDQEDSWIIKNKYGEYSGKPGISNYCATGYWPKKLVHLDNEIVNGSSYSRTNYAFPAIRLADLYLMYTEALNEVKDAPDAEVYEYIDHVRARAGLDGVVSSWSAHSSNPSKPGTKAGMRKIIQQERLIEMAFEGSRFWDLRRWKLAYEYMNNPIRGWSVTKADYREYYRLTTLYNQKFELRDYLWPIKEGEIIINPNLVQNPGW